MSKAHYQCCSQLGCISGSLPTPWTLSRQKKVGTPPSLRRWDDVMSTQWSGAGGPRSPGQGMGRLPTGHGSKSGHTILTLARVAMRMTMSTGTHPMTDRALECCRTSRTLSAQSPRAAIRARFEHLAVGGVDAPLRPAPWSKQGARSCPGGSWSGERARFRRAGTWEAWGGAAWVSTPP